MSWLDRIRSRTLPPSAVGGVEIPPAATFGPPYGCPDCEYSDNDASRTYAHLMEQHHDRRRVPRNVAA